ncbi:uncharacterized protein LOC129737850 [Uranotaenia lowii]|uniref:uncharacterized protein LOC129737850 n=1 Tax=Uranotaenia lowii TaxID=190385 RepID=UPI0024783580|nr:uncharacterized protein LOC129737850 [Uranotaenia lowii]
MNQQKNQQSKESTGPKGSGEIVGFCRKLFRSGTGAVSSWKLKLDATSAANGAQLGWSSDDNIGRCKEEGEEEKETKLCLKYGHPKIKCLAEKACIVCSGTHSSETCTAKTKFCANCKGNHSPLDRNCPVYLYETAVLKVKTEQNITLDAARRIVQTPSTTSYAEIVKNHNDVFNQQRKKQQPKKITAPTESNQQMEQQQQQQNQKRIHHTTEPTIHSIVSPPRKKSTPQASPITSGDKAEDDPQQQQNDTLINSETRKLTRETNRVSSPTPSTLSKTALPPPSNPKPKHDPRQNYTFMK